MPLSVHLGFQPDPNILNNLRDKLHSEIHLTSGKDVPEAADYHILVMGRPKREHLLASPDLHTLLIPFAGLPTETATLMREFSEIAIHNLHHNAIPTAEMAITLMMAAAKTIVPSDRDFRQHDWTPRYRPNPAMLLQGKTILILGYGAVGQAVGMVCKALGMQVMGIRRSNTQAHEDIYSPETLHDLLPKAQVLIICVPGTPDTEGMIGKEELALLLTGAVVVNVGRAAVIDEEALYQALKDGHLQAAGLDVWYQYPADVEARHHTPPSRFPFHKLENVVMSPHRAGGGGQPEIEYLRMDALADFLMLAVEGKPLPHRVNLEVGY